MDLSLFDRPYFRAHQEQGEKGGKSHKIPVRSLFLIELQTIDFNLLKQTAMEINVKQNENQILIQLEGSLDIYTSLDLKHALEEHVKGNAPDVVIDLDKLTYIDSSGIGILIKALNYIQGLNGTLCVANLKPVIEKVFKVSGLTSYFEIIDHDDFQSRYPQFAGS